MGILTQGVLRWGILSVFPKPMPVRYNAAVFPRFFTTNSSMNLPYLPLDSLAASLGENRTFETDGSLCFTTRNHSNCLSLKQHMYGWFSRDRKSGEFSQSFRENKTYTNAVVSLKVLWINGTFMKPPIKQINYSNIFFPYRPRQPKYAPHCVGDYEGEQWPWTDCQSHATTWADKGHKFSLSPDMEEISGSVYRRVAEGGEFQQDVGRNPFDKWLLCGVNGSCSDLSPFIVLQGGGIGMSDSSCTYEATSPALNGKTVYQVNKTTYNISCQRVAPAPGQYPPTPVCVYPPFLFILSNNSFDSCSNDTCFLSQCWNITVHSNALVARIPRWVPVPVDSPDSMTLFREKRDFGVTAAIVALISLAAVAATAAAIALDTSVKAAAELNNLADSVATALDRQSSLDGKMKGGIMVLNQRVDLVEEQLDVLWQLAQLGCERKFRALCITSIQYENFTRAANLSRSLSQYLSGNWSQDFDGTLEELRQEITHINSTRLDISVAKGLSSWFHRALSHVKEWAGMAGMGVFMLGGLMLLLWLLCRLRAQHRQDKVILAQALMAVDIGASPQVWLNMLNKEAQL